jgi:GNAT superfamily N-acetyltransferase
VDETPTSGDGTVMDAERAAQIIGAASGLAVRPVRADDWPRVLAIAATAYPPEVESPAEMRAKAAAGWLLVHDPRPIAAYALAVPWASYEPPAMHLVDVPKAHEPTTLWVHDVCVHRDWHGRGIGQRLMAGLVDVARAAGLDALIAVAVDGAEEVWFRGGWQRADTPLPDGYAAGSVPIVHLLSGRRWPPPGG